MHKCKVCGFPALLGRILQWNENGSVISRQQENFRVIMIEADFLTRLIDAIEDELEQPVRRMVFETQRDVSSLVIDIALTELAWGLGLKKPFKRFSSRFLDRFAILTGQCYSNSFDYNPGRSSGGVIRNPYDRELMVANIMGAMETLEGVPYRYEWQKRGNEDYLFAEPEPGAIGRKERAHPDFIPLKPGNRRFDRCPRCDKPLALRDLKWMEEEGVIMDLRRGVRMVFIDFYSCKMVLEKLSREVGPDFAQIVVDTERAFFIRHIWEQFLSERRHSEPLPRQELYRQVLETLALRGQGNPVEHSIEGERFSVTIENPFNEQVLAGFLSALYECSEGVVPEVDWKWVDRQTLRFRLEPAAPQR